MVSSDESREPTTKGTGGSCASESRRDEGDDSGDSHARPPSSGRCPSSLSSSFFFFFFFFFFSAAKQPGDVSSYSYVGDRIVDGSVPCLSITGEGPKQGCNVGQTAEYHELVRMVRELHREQNRRVRMLLVENVEKGARAAYVGEPCFSQQLVTAITAYGYNCWWRTIGARSFGPLVRNRTFYVFVPANQTFFGRSIVWGDVVPEAPPLSDDRFITIDTR